MVNVCACANRNRYRSQEGAIDGRSGVDVEGGREYVWLGGRGVREAMTREAGLGSV